MYVTKEYWLCSQQKKLEIKHIDTSVNANFKDLQLFYNMFIHDEILSNHIDLNWDKLWITKAWYMHLRQA